MTRRKRIKHHFVLPDCQVKPGVRTDHLIWASKFVAEQRPDVIVCMGDFWDFPSLSSWDRGKAAAENRRYSKDFQAGVDAMERFMAQCEKLKGYKPRLVFTKGNHEQRLDRYANDNPAIDSLPDPMEYLRSRGWEVYDFLVPIRVDGIWYCHYFCRNASGRVTASKFGQPNARAQAMREMVSTIAGHKQGLDTHVHEATGGRIRAIIAGSCYMHREGYLTPQGNDHWQGCLMLHDVQNGDYDLREVSLRYLKRRYGK